MAGVFLVLGGAMLAGIFNLAAQRRERPSEIDVLFNLARIAVVSVMVGMTLTIVFGLWLVADLDLVKWSDGWVIAAVILWFVANALGTNGPHPDRRTREPAERLAAEGDQPSPELGPPLRDPLSLALSWGSGLVVIAILVLMIWKPGH